MFIRYFDHQIIYGEKVVFCMEHLRFSNNVDFLELSKIKIIN